jgi:hypothetical protein
MTLAQQLAMLHDDPNETAYKDTLYFNTKREYQEWLTRRQQN